MRAEWGQAHRPGADRGRAAGRRGRSWSPSSTARRRRASLQPLADLARLARAHDALLVADVVVTLGGCEVARRPLGRGRGGRGRHAEVPAAARRAWRRSRTTRAPRGRAAGGGATVRSNYLDLGQLARLLEPGALQPSHRADVHGLRPARGAARRRTRKGWRRASRGTASTATRCAPASTRWG